MLLVLFHLLFHLLHLLDINLVDTCFTVEVEPLTLVRVNSWSWVRVVEMIDMNLLICEMSSIFLIVFKNKIW